MRKTLRRAVVLGLLAFAAPFAALPLAKPAAAMPEASAPVLPDVVDTPAATPQPVLPAVPESRSFDADAPILLNDGGEEITVSVQEFLIGTAASASGAVLSSVEAAILDANDQPVQSAEASPNVSSWSLKNFDSQLRFGELPEGSYTYMVVLTDSNGQTLCFMSDFTVSGSASSTATYWTVQDPSGTKLGQLVQETEEAVAEAVESEAEAVTETKKGMWSWLLG